MMQRAQPQPVGHHVRPILAVPAHVSRFHDSVKAKLASGATAARWYSRRVGKSKSSERFMGTPSAKIEPEPRLRARVKVRPKAQLTLPEEIRRALHIGEGDEVEFAIHDDGTVTIRGYVSIPTDQAWFFTPGWLAGEREADDEIAAGRGTVHESAEDMFAHLDPLGSADE
jgi:antitoxin PrlF